MPGGCSFVLGSQEAPESGVTIYLSSGESALPASASARTIIPSSLLDALHYELELRGPGGQLINRSIAAGEGSVQLSLASGQWDISARAYKTDNSLAGTGHLTVTVIPGKMSILISMAAEWSFELEGITAYLATQPTNTAATPYVIALKAFDAGSGTEITDLTMALAAATGKYVILDLSGAHYSGPAVLDQVVSPGPGPLGPRINDTGIGGRIKGIRLPEGKGITAIGEYAFYYCSGLTSITLPAGVISIGQRAFEYTSLASVTFEGSMPPTFGTNVFASTALNASGVVHVPSAAVGAYTTALSGQIGSATITGY
jgi:hypothetical protein